MTKDGRDDHLKEKKKKKSCCWFHKRHHLQKIFQNETSSKYGQFMKELNEINSIILLKKQNDKLTP